MPKISVIVRKAYGAGLYAMAGPAFDPDACLALPDAKIAVMGPQAAINAVFYNQLQAIEDEDERARRTEELRAEYKEEIDILHLASELVVDAVVAAGRAARGARQALRGLRLARALVAGEAQRRHARLGRGTRFEGCLRARTPTSHPAIAGGFWPSAPHRRPRWPRSRWPARARAGASGGLRPDAGAGGRHLHRLRGRHRADRVRVGVLADRIGERLVLASGPALGGVALALATLARGYPGRARRCRLAGVFAAAATSGSGRAVFGWFPRAERGFALGLRQTACRWARRPPPFRSRRWPPRPRSTSRCWCWRARSFSRRSSPESGCAIRRRAARPRRRPRPRLAIRASGGWARRAH